MRTQGWLRMYSRRNPCVRNLPDDRDDGSYEVLPQVSAPKNQPYVATRNGPGERREQPALSIGRKVGSGKRWEQCHADTALDQTL